MENKRLLIIALNWPAPSYSAAGIRIFQLIKYFQDHGYCITLACTADLPVVAFRALKIEPVQIKVNNSGFDVFVKELNPDIVLFDRFTAEEQFGWRVAEFAPKAIRILDTEDLHSLRKTREEAIKKNIEFTSDLWLESDTTKREVASIYRCDLSLIISRFELDLLTQHIGIDPSILMYLPFMLENIMDAQQTAFNSYEQRKDFVFIGYGGHAPNVDAIEQLKSNFWPEIRKVLPLAKLHIYGGNLPQKITQLHHEKEGFLIQGWAPISNDVIGSARVLLAPLRFGAGLKGKLVEAMQNGTPFVTTSIGVEGMYDEKDWNGMGCDDPKVFAETAIRLYDNQENWERAQQLGCSMFNRLFDKKEWIPKLDLQLNSILEDLLVHRRKNFFGSLLYHQTLASTKYIAKWIQEKNKGQ
ncbi:MAG: glycosyltransferase family 4 protein [Flavobacteriaceae bacterium]